MMPRDRWPRTCSVSSTSPGRFASAVTLLTMALRPAEASDAFNQVRTQRIQQEREP
jgi:hypothetical protein